MQDELERAIRIICKCVKELEVDYESKSPAEQEKHVYRSMLTVLNEFLENEESAVEIEKSMRQLIRTTAGVAD